MSELACIAIAEVDLMAADRDTLENVATSHATAAARASALVNRAKPWGEKTAARARIVWATLGWMQEVQEGKKLNAVERAEAFAAHGREQRFAASTRRWTVPVDVLEEAIVDQPPTTSSTSTYVENSKSTRAGARATAERKTGPKERSRRPARRAPRSIATQRFARDLAAWRPHLDSGHIGRVCRIVESIGLDAERWTVRDLNEAMNAAMAGLGYAGQPAAQREPVGHFVASARFAVRLFEQSGQELPSERARRESDDWHRRVERDRREVERAAAERAAIAADPAVQAAIDEMKRLFPTPPKTPKRRLR